MNVDYLRLFNSMAYLVYFFFKRVVTCMIKIVIKIHIIFYRKYKCVESTFEIVYDKVKIVLTVVVYFKRLKCYYMHCIFPLFAECMVLKNIGKFCDIID